MCPWGVSSTCCGRGNVIIVPYHGCGSVPIGSNCVMAVIFRRASFTRLALSSRNTPTPSAPFGPVRSQLDSDERVPDFATPDEAENGLPCPGADSDERLARKSIAAGMARNGDGSRVPDQTNSSCQLGGRPERLLPQLLTTGCNVGFQRGWAYRNPDPNGALNHL